MPALLQEDFILLCGRVREAFLLFSSVFCLYRERERERGSVRRSERERERGSVRGSEREREREKGWREYIYGVLCMLPWFQYVLPL